MADPSRGFIATVAEAMIDHPTLVVGYEGDHVVIVVVDRPPTEDDPGDPVCSHPYTADGLAAAIQCAEAGAFPFDDRDPLERDPDHDI